MSAGAQPGNQHGVKLKDPEVRKRAYDKFCQWIALGKSKDSFTFKEGDLKCTWRTLEKYFEDNPDEFQPIHKEFAFSEGYAIWEEIVEQSAKGEKEKANTASLQMVMRNKYGWDKEHKSKDPEAHSNFEKLLQFFKATSKEPETKSAPDKDHID